MSEERFEYDECTGIKDLSIDEDDDQFLYPTQIVEILNEQQATISRLKNENEQLKQENMALDNENAEHLADNIRELELLEKLTKFLHECNLSNEQKALFREMITEEDLQPKLEVEK